MRQLIFPFAIKSLDEINLLADKNQRAFLKEISEEDNNYNRASGSWGSCNLTNPIDRNNSEAANTSGQRIIHLVDSCQYNGLKDSILFQELTTKYQHYRNN